MAFQNTALTCHSVSVTHPPECFSLIKTTKRCSGQTSNSWMKGYPYATRLVTSGASLVTFNCICIHLERCYVFCLCVRAHRPQRPDCTTPLLPAPENYRILRFCVYQRRTMLHPTREGLPDASEAAGELPCHCPWCEKGICQSKRDPLPPIFWPIRALDQKAFSRDRGLRDSMSR